jgi:hypothetical protein
MTRKQPKPDTSLTITDLDIANFYITKNWVTQEWLPIITVYGAGLYTLFKSTANEDLGNKWFISLRTIEEYMMISQKTIIVYSWLLEACKLISIKSGEDGFANEYTILVPPRVTDDLLKKIIVELSKPAPELSAKSDWHRFKQRAIERINKWKSLRECGKTSQYKHMAAETQTGQHDKFSTNGSKPKPEPVEIKPDTTELDELTQLLVECFANNKPSLTEESAAKMIQTYGADAVEQQLEWLELRETDAPLRTLRAALKNGWTKPKPVGKPKEKPWYDEMDPSLFAN